MPPPLTVESLAEQLIGIIDFPQSLVSRRQASHAHWAEFFDANKNLAAFADRLLSVARTSHQ